MIFEKYKCVYCIELFLRGFENLNFLIREMILKIQNFFLTLLYVTHGKKSKTIYTDLKYNRYMTDDKNYIY